MGDSSKNYTNPYNLRGSIKKINMKDFIETDEE